MRFIPNKVLVYGLVSGGLSILIHALLFMLGPQSYFSIWSNLPAFVMLLVSFAATWQLRASQGGAIGFQSAVFSAYTVMIVHGLLSVIIEWTLYNIVDPGFYLIAAEVKMERILESMETYSRWIDYSESDIEEIVMTAQSADYHFYFKDALSKFLLGAIINFLFALILATILKKEPTTHERA